VAKQWWPDLQWVSTGERPILSTLNGDPAERFTLDACSAHSEGPKSLTKLELPDHIVFDRGP
jgi:hypothetical protein